MPERSHAVLRVEPHQIPALRAAFDDAANSVDRQVRDLRTDGQIVEPWMGDPTSAKVKQIYDANAINGPRATLTHQEMYRDELIKVAENLASMAEEYRRTEGDNEALWGGRV